MYKAIYIGVITPLVTRELVAAHLAVSPPPLYQRISSFVGLTLTGWTSAAHQRLIH